MADAVSTPAVARQMSGTDPSGANILAVLVKATYVLLPDGRVLESKQQLPLNDALVPDPDDPRLLADDTDLYPHKLATDVVLKGHAYAPGPRPKFGVALRVEAASKIVQVVGDRRCTLTRAGGIVFSPPEPVTKVPLRYDRAYGGEDAAATAKHGNPYEELARYLAPELAALRPSYWSYPRNPAGRGFLVEGTAEAVERVELPNLEDPLDPLTPERLVCGRLERWPRMPLPQAMAWVSGGWFPRLAYFGFVPEHEPPEQPIAEVVRGHAPADILEDKPIVDKLDFRATNGASLGLQLPYLQGGEEIELSNLHPSAARVAFRLPKARPQIWTDGRNGKLSETKPVIHSVIIEPDEGRFSIVWRGSAPALRPYMPEELEKMPFLVRWS
jgi:hypothetical protein